MSVKIALLKSNEEVISDIKEVTDETGTLVYYSFKDPFVVKIGERKYDDESDEQKLYSLTFTPWVLLSHDKEYFINPDWVVTIYNTTPDIEFSYLERTNGRPGNDGHDGATGGGTTGETDDTD
jgi:hypothetical protein